MKKHGEQIYEKIGNRGDYIRAMKIFNCSLDEVKRKNTIDVLEMLGIDNIMNA